MFLEVSGSREVFEEFPALERLVLVQRREGEVFDVERDAVTEGQHQDDGADKREGEPDRITQDFHRFPSCIGPEAPPFEPALQERR